MKPPAEWRQLETERQQQQACLTEIDDALVQALTTQESEVGSPGVPPTRRRERIARQQMKGFRAQRYACEQQTARFEEMLRAQAATPPVLPKPARPAVRIATRSARCERRSRRRQSLACARQAAMQQGQLKASLGLSPAGTGAASDEVFERDSAALLELIRGAGEGPRPGRTKRSPEPSRRYAPGSPRIARPTRRSSRTIRTRQRGSSRPPKRCSAWPRRGRPSFGLGVTPRGSRPTSRPGCDGTPRRRRGLPWRRAAADSTLRPTPRPRPPGRGRTP